MKFTKKYPLLFLLTLLTLCCFAQKEQYRGSHGKDGYIIEGEMTVYLKNKQTITGEFRINNIKMRGLDIDYNDIDFIIFRNDRYEYVNTGKRVPQLLKTFHRSNPLEERGRVMFYEGFAKFKPKVNKQLGWYGNSYKINEFMKKADMEVAVKYQPLKAGKLIKKYFSDCPALMEIYNNKQERKRVSIGTIYQEYNKCGNN